MTKYKCLICDKKIIETELFDDYVEVTKDKDQILNYHHKCYSIEIGNDDYNCINKKFKVVRIKKISEIKLGHWEKDKTLNNSKKDMERLRKNDE